MVHRGTSAPKQTKTIPDNIDIKIGIKHKLSVKFVSRLVMYAKINRSTGLRIVVNIDERCRGAQ